MYDQFTNIDSSDFKSNGLYLIFPNKTCLDFSRENIEKETEKFWNDPSRITPQIKKAVDFQKCYFCPHKEQKDICDAIRPVLPFLEDVDKYLSFDKVTAVFKGKGEVLHVVNTDMQQALKYVSILSLVYYHALGGKYWKYYYGIIPIMRPKEIAGRIFLNMYYMHKGDKEEITDLIEEFREQMRVASQNQVKRIGLISKNDAFLNAFVSSQVVTEILSFKIEEMLEKSISEFSKIG